MSIARNAALVAAAGLAFTLAGCNSGHGKHTSEGLAQAQQRMADMKAATSWDLARQQYLVGDLSKALDNVDQSIEYSPSVPKSHTLRGRILIELGQLEQSIESFKRAVAIDPAFHEAHYYLGIAMERVSDFERAGDAYETAANLDPSNSQYAIAAAEMLIELGYIERAEELLRSRTAMFEHNAGVRQTLGHLAMLRGDSADAVAMFREARLLAPDDLSVAEDLALSLASNSDWVEAEYTLRTLLKSKDFTDRRDLKRMHARALVAIDRPVEARTILLALTTDEAGRNDWQALIDLASVALILKDDARARLSARRALALVPDHPEPYAMLAAVQFRNGELEGALDSLNKAVERSRGDATPALMRGVVLSRLGRQAEAEASFNLALQIDPTDERAMRMIAGVGDDEN
jgi:Flp pilus assembly protein TadD